MSARFFGSSKQPLFGIYHPARGQRGAKHSVLLCPPLGHEYVRSHWAMRTLASKLSRKGMNVFRFDYRGTGDSFGEIEDVTSLQDFVADTVTAAVELMETSTGNSSDARLSLVGLRLGGPIAAFAANELITNDLKAEVVCWDCPLDGKSYLSELRAMHEQMIDLWTCPIETENSETHEEILGFRFRRSLLNEIQQYRGNEMAANADSRLSVVNSRDTLKPWHDLAVQQTSDDLAVFSTDDASDWDDLNYIEEAWLPIHGSPLIVDTLQSKATSKRQTANQELTTVGAS